MASHFYTNNCQKCVDIKPSFQKLADGMRKIYKFGPVNCKRSLSETNFCQNQGVSLKNFPFFGVVTNGVLIIFYVNKNIHNLL